MYLAGSITGEQQLILAPLQKGPVILCHQIFDWATNHSDDCTFIYFHCIYHCSTCQV